MSVVSSSDRLYRVRRPLAAFCAGVAVAILGGLIGLGGAEFRLPLLIAVFELYPHRAVRINLLISFATLAAAAIVRLGFIQDTDIGTCDPTIIAMLFGGVVAAWIGAGWLGRVPKTRVSGVISVLLVSIAALLILETVFAGSTAFVLPPDQWVRIPVAVVAGVIVGAISSMLGVAGGEFIIPFLIFVLGADIKTAGTASVLISTPIVIAGIVRHWIAGKFRSRSMLTYLVLPMSLGSLLGAMVGGYISAYTPNDALRIILATVLIVSAIKLWLKQPDR